MTEALRSDPLAYDSFNDFFTRELAPGTRPLAGDERTIVSPADGTLSEIGIAAPDKRIEAKGIGYGLEELLGEPPGGHPDATFGAFATIYLAPHNYHRVHLPLSGALTRTRYVPGKRFSVNAATVARIPALFCQNERVLCWFDTAAGPMVVALIGALNVSSISTRWLGEIRSGEARVWRELGRPQQRYARGDEIAQFNLGSTVILLLPASTSVWDEELSADATVRVGQALGRVVDGHGPA